MYHFSYKELNSRFNSKPSNRSCNYNLRASYRHPQQKAGNTMFNYSSYKSETTTCPLFVITGDDIISLLITFSYII